MTDQTIPLQPVYEKPKRSGSLRGRLLLTNLLIVSISIIGTGYYIFTRTNSLNISITDNLNNLVLQQARDQLTNTSILQAQEVNNFFIQQRKAIEIVNTTISNLLSKEEVTNNPAYWDAADNLTQLPNGSWTNTALDVGAVFAPKRDDLPKSLIVEINSLMQLNLSIPETLAQYPDVFRIYFGSINGEGIYYPYRSLSAVFPSNYDVTNQQWFITSSPEQNPDRNIIWSAPYESESLFEIVLTISNPVYDGRDIFRGVTAADIRLNNITSIVSSISIAKTGYALLVDKNNRLIALSENGYQDLGFITQAVPLGEVLIPALYPSIPPELFSLFDSISTSESGITSFNFNGSERFVSYAQIPEIGYSLILIVPSSELLAEATAAQQLIAQETANTYSRSILLGTIILIIAIVITFLIGNGLTSPLQRLTKTADEITRGNINSESDIQSNDEIGILSKALNTMTSSLRNNIQSLEQKVDERTEDLVRKTLRLQAASQIAHDATEMQDISTLLGRTAELISNRFGFYHTGIFLLDEQGEFAVLLAASSEGGQRMLARGHRLNTNQQGLVAAAARENRPYIILDVETDKNYLKNPDLPLTRSEATLPLSARGKILGVLDIQSVEPNAFREDDIDVLRTMADQIGLAIQNARAVVENQNSLQMLEAVLAGNVQSTWGDQISKGKKSYRYSSSGIIPVVSGDNTMVGIQEDSNSLDIPIILRGQKIGDITLIRKTGVDWSESERSLALDISKQIGLALENARLLDETSRRAENEKAISDITTKIRSVNTPQFMIDVAKEELRKILGAQEVKIRPFTPGGTKQTEGN